MRCNCGRKSSVVYDVAIFQSQFIKAKRVVRASKEQVRTRKLAPAEFIGGIDIQTSLEVLNCEGEVPQIRAGCTTKHVGRCICPVIDRKSGVEGKSVELG